MKAVVAKKFGSPHMLKVEEVGLPEVSSNKVLVKVISAGVNPVDTYVQEGAFFTLPELPYTPGLDAAGIVHSVGENVTNFQVGQRVFLSGRSIRRHGTYAEYTAVDEEDVFPLDEKLSYDQGAAIGVPYFTAHRALVIKAKSIAGETVLIHGASGAVGLASVQVAKHLGMTVIGTGGTSVGLDLIKDNGADYAFNHKEDNYMQKIMESTHGKGVNVVIEMLANVNLENDLDILSPRGSVIIVGCHGSLNLNLRKTMVPETEIIGLSLLSSSKEEWKETGKAIVNGAKEGWIKPVIDRSYPLAQASQAQYDIMHSKGAKGKLVLHVQDP